MWRSARVKAAQSVIVTFTLHTRSLFRLSCFAALGRPLLEHIVHNLNTFFSSLHFWLHVYHCRRADDVVEAKKDSRCVVCSMCLNAKSAPCWTFNFFFTTCNYHRAVEPHRCRTPWSWICKTSKNLLLFHHQHARVYLLTTVIFAVTKWESKTQQKTSCLQLVSLQVRSVQLMSLQVIPLQCMSPWAQRVFSTCLPSSKSVGLALDASGVKYFKHMQPISQGTTSPVLNISNQYYLVPWFLHLKVVSPAGSPISTSVKVNMFRRYVNFDQIIRKWGGYKQQHTSHPS